MQLDAQTGTLFLLVAAVVAMLSKRLRLPYAIGLVAAGVGLAAVPFAPRIELTRDLIYTVLLPPLLFEAAYHIDWSHLRRNALVVGVLATLGVVISGAATAAGMHLLLGWPWMDSLIFGALIAATDPVSVIAIFREARAGGRLLLLIEAESLINDGTAAVAFAVVVAFVIGPPFGAGGVALLLVKSIGGGVACGVATGIVSLLLMGRTKDYVVEITWTAVAAWGSFLLADSLGMSGVLATIAAGLAMRNFGKIDRVTPRGRQAIEHFWEFAAFVANSMVFLLLGAEQSHQRILPFWIPVLTGIAVVLVARALSVFPCCALFGWSQQRVTGRHQLALFWGGLRGALALALALALPAGLPMHDAIVTVSFGVVAFSIFVQALTIAPLLRRIGEIPSRQIGSGHDGGA